MQFDVLHQISTGRNEADLDVVAQGKACSAEKISLNKAVGRYVRLSIADEEGPIPLYEVHVAGSMMESAEDGISLIKSRCAQTVPTHLLRSLPIIIRIRSGSRVIILVMWISI